MITSIEPKAGSWILLVGPRSLNSTMLTAIARLPAPVPQAQVGERCSLRVLDGGNRFNAYTVARAARGRQEVLNRITVSRAFTCYQVLSLLESTPATKAPFVVLDLLNTFYDESVPIGERKRLLRSCIAHLERLVVPSAPRVPTGCCASAEAAAPPPKNGGRQGCCADGAPDGSGWKPPWLVAGGSSAPHGAEAALKVRGQADGGWKPPRLVVSVHPPAIPSQAAIELLSLLQASAADTFFAQPPASALEPMRLF